MRSLVEVINENLIYEVREKVYSEDIEGVTEFCNDVLSGDNWKVNKDLSVDIDKTSGSGYDMSFVFPNNVTKIPDFIKFQSPAHHGQDTLDRHKLSAQPQFTDKYTVFQKFRIHLLDTAKKCNCNWKVKPCACLSEISRR